MRVMITGASGLLGRYLCRTVPYDIVSHRLAVGCSNSVAVRDYCRVDISDGDLFARLCDNYKPDVIIHAAAIGSVDYCECNQDRATLVNVHGTANVLQAASENGAYVVYISSNAVYAGDDPPYDSLSERDPVNHYGFTKVQAENLVREYDGRWNIVRPIMLFGYPRRGGRGNWVTRIEEFLGAGMPLSVVDDTVTQPTYAEDCARFVWWIVDNAMGGDGYCGNHSFNYGGYDRLSLYDFAREVCRVWGYDESLLEPVPSSCFPDLAPRPVDTTYDPGSMYQSVPPARLYDGLRRMWGEHCDY